MVKKKTTKRRPRRRGKSTARQLAMLRKARAAIPFLAQGYSYETVAGFIGYRSRQACHYAVSRLVQHEHEAATEAARALKKIYARRLDQLLQGVMPRAVQTGDPMLIASTLRVLDSMDRLHGFSKPMKIAPVTPDGDEAAPVTAVLDLGAALAKVRAMEEPGGVLSRRM